MPGRVYEDHLCPRCQIGILFETAGGELMCPSGECGHSFDRDGNCLTDFGRDSAEGGQR